MVTGGRWGTVLKRGRALALCALLMLGVAVLFRQDWSRGSHTRPARGPVVASSMLARLPLSFEPNRGQAATPVKFLSRGSGYGLYLTSREAVLALSSVNTGSRRAETAFVHMQFAAAAAHPSVQAGEALPGHTNYLVGNDPSRWLHNVQQFARVHYAEVYPGVDLDFYGNQGHLEYDFEVNPGADPRQIEMKFEGADNLRIDPQGNLILFVGNRELHFEAPQIYQSGRSGQEKVEGAFVLRSADRVGFEVGNYDRSRTLVIDPILAYSTYLGGSGAESCAAIAGASFIAHCPAVTVDSAQRVYIAGATTSAAGWPTPSTGSAATITPGGGSSDVFVARISSTGTGLALDYLTFIGGTATDYPTGIGVDSGFDVYVAGNTNSSDFPTVNGLQSTASGNHGFLSKLDPTGSVNLYSTYIGGSGSDSVGAMTIDSHANAYLFGTTTSSDFPTTPGALQAASKATNQFFFSKLDPAQNGPNSLLYSTYIGGSNPANGVVQGGAITVDSASNVYLAGGTNFTDMPTLNAYQGALQGGTNLWIARLLAPTNNTQVYTLSYETYFGAPGDSSQVDIAYGVATDGTNTYVTGSTTSNALPVPTGTTPFQGSNAGGTDAFLAKFALPTLIGTAQGTVPLSYFTYLGGSATDIGLSLVVDPTQNARIVGFTQSSNFPNSNPLTGSSGGGTDAFYARLVTTGSSTATNANSTSILGGSGTDIGTSVAIDAALNSYIAGETASSNFPSATSPGLPAIAPLQATLSGSSDAFISKLAPSISGLSLVCPSGSTCPGVTPVTPSPVGVGNSVIFTYPIYNTGDPVNGAVFTASVNQLPNAAANSTISTANANLGSCTTTSSTAICNLGTVPTSSQVTTTSGGTTTTTTSAAATVTITAVATAPAITSPTPTQPPPIGNTGTLSVPGTSLQQTASLSAVVNDFGIQATPNTATVTNGNTATYQILVTPSGPIPESISLGQCGNLPPGTTCQFKPNPIPNLNNGAMSSTLEITTTARVTTTGKLFHHGSPIYAFWFPISGLALVGAGATRRRRWLIALVVLCILLVMGLQAGCGSSTGTTTTTTGTPNGTYTITLNATCGSNATRSTAVTLIVK